MQATAWTCGGSAPSTSYTPARPVLSHRQRLHALLPAGSSSHAGAVASGPAAPAAGAAIAAGRRRVCAHAARKSAVAEPSAAKKAVDGYGASSIQVLEGLEPVRKRPGMYIGGTGSDGLHHLVWELVDNSVDEVQGGHATQADVEVDLSSGWVSVTDNGRGIPTDLHPATGKSALETVLTVLHAGGKFGGDSSGYKVSGGLHGVGISVVNALSQELEVVVWRGGVRHTQRYSRGAPVSELQHEQLPPAEAGRTGTQVRFLYDSTIFAKDVKYSPDVIATRLHELAFLNSGATLRFRATRGAGKLVQGKSKYLASRKDRAADADGESDGEGAGSAGEDDDSAAAANGNGNGLAHSGNGNAAAGSSNGNGDGPAAATAAAGGWQAFSAAGGLREFIGCLHTGLTPLHPTICASRSAQGVAVEVALQWCSDSFKEDLRGFANSIATIDGGTHIEGLRSGLTRTINALAKKQKILKEGDGSLSGEHVREGLGAVVSVKVPEPEFEGQTKTRLGNPEVKKIVEGAVQEVVSEWLETHPAALSALLGKALSAAKAAEAAKKARELVRRKSVLTRTTLPGKLADCTSDKRAETEIYLVEGDSAGGSAKQARDRRFQAILPLKGKILNVERANNESAVYDNDEISKLIVALGLGKDKGIEGLRYGKVVILTDADVDGAHIRTLLLTFLFRYCVQLFESGSVYVAVPPLYKLEKGGRGGSAAVHWAFSEDELKALTRGLAPGSYTVQRFKGLGEMMPEQLWDTTLNPATRLLRRLTLQDASQASALFALLMGDKVAPRRALIEEHGNRIKSLQDLDI